MSTARFGRGHKAMALVPLALLSAAWTASIAGAGATSAVSAETRPDTTLPDGSSVPTEAIEAPASVSSAGGLNDGLAPGLRGDPVQVASRVTTSGIPAAALAAYQRAETVINSADQGCHLTWQLIAAIGKVESDHGRVNGNSLDVKGVAQPGIYGIALDGSHGTARISDTDAGQYDADATFDRAIGPMQFIPSTWSVVGVDADGDGKRNPQDVDDAALATAVYLCSGTDDLATVTGQRAAVYRYNHSEPYVDLVLSIMQAYLDGEFTSVPERHHVGGLPAAGRAAATEGRRQERRQGQPRQRRWQRQQRRQRQRAAERARRARQRAAQRARRARPDRRPGPAGPEHPAAAVDLDPAGRPGPHPRAGGPAVHARGLHRQHPARPTTRSTSACTTTRTSERLIPSLLGIRIGARSSSRAGEERTRDRRIETRRDVPTRSLRRPSG